MFLFSRAMDLANGPRDDVQKCPMAACQQAQTLQVNREAGIPARKHSFC